MARPGAFIPALEGAKEFVAAQDGPKQLKHESEHGYFTLLKVGGRELGVSFQGSEIRLKGCGLRSGFNSGSGLGQMWPFHAPPRCNDVPLLAGLGRMRC